jgi:hypothetical protein
LGIEGIVSKRLDSPVPSGPLKVWLKNPSEAVRREREEDWNMKGSTSLLLAIGTR